MLYSGYLHGWPRGTTACRCMNMQGWSFGSRPCICVYVHRLHRPEDWLMDDHRHRTTAARGGSEGEAVVVPWFSTPQFLHRGCQHVSNALVAYLTSGSGTLPLKFANRPQRVLTRTPLHFRVCPFCVRVDREQFGEPYWHRIHQVPGVLACPHHSVYLENSSVYGSRA